MNLQDIRVEMQLNDELFEAFKGILFPSGIKFCNPDFLVCDEDKARAGKVFDDDSVAFPTEQECIDAAATAEKLIQGAGIRAKYAALLQAVAKPYFPEERETWFKQQEAAEKYAADGTITTFLQNMADARGIAVAELVAKIEENIEAYDSAIATLLGTQQKELDELGA